MGNWETWGMPATPAVAATPAATTPNATPAATTQTTPVPVQTPAGPVAPTLATVQGTAYGLSKEFAADNPVRMPSPTDSALLAAARIRREALAKSGRDSTRLVGTQVYSNSYLGSVG